MSDPRANLTTFILNMVAHGATSHEQIDAVMTECNRWIDEMLDQHAAEEIAKRKCENCTYFKYDDECHVPSSDEEDALGEKLPIWSAYVLPEYCCPQFKEKEDDSND